MRYLGISQFHRKFIYISYIPYTHSLKIILCICDDFVHETKLHRVASFGSLESFGFGSMSDFGFAEQGCLFLKFGVIFKATDTGPRLPAT